LEIAFRLSRKIQHSGLVPLPASMSCRLGRQGFLPRNLFSLSSSRFQPLETGRQGYKKAFL
jgi:hypothetical protein